MKKTKLNEHVVKSSPAPDTGRIRKTGKEEVTPEERLRMVAAAAYYRAEKRCFTNGDPFKDWCEAEAEIDAQLSP